jgi:hypothetical protein
MLLLFYPSLVQIFSSQPCSQTPSVHVLTLMWETKTNIVTYKKCRKDNLNIEVSHLYKAKGTTVLYDLQWRYRHYPESRYHTASCLGIYFPGFVLASSRHGLQIDKRFCHKKCLLNLCSLNSESNMNTNKHGNRLCLFYILVEKNNQLSYKSILTT